MTNWSDVKKEEFLTLAGNYSALEIFNAGNDLLAGLSMKQLDAEFQRLIKRGSIKAPIRNGALKAGSLGSLKSTSAKRSIIDGEQELSYDYTIKPQFNIEILNTGGLGDYLTRNCESEARTVRYRHLVSYCSILQSSVWPSSVRRTSLLYHRQPNCK
jgi:hypothetical protein